MKFVLRLIMMVAITIGLIIGSTSFAHADEPVVDLGGIQYAEAQFKTDGSAAAKASLRAQSGAKVVLNVHVNPMPKQQIKRCWKVKPGTWIKNEVIDPATGRPAVINWKVPAGDNTFCTKKGAGKQVFKKSCGNRVWGVPGGPKSPPKSLPRIKVKVQIQDYLTFKGKLKVQTSQSGSASAYVVQYYEGKKVCEASASVRGTGYVSVEAYISVRARTFTAIRVSATNSAQVSANTQITASGSLKAAVRLVLVGEARAMCNFTPPPPPPPPANQPPTGEIVQFPAHLYPGGEYRAKVVGSDPEDLGNVTLDYTVTGGATKIVDANHPEICDVEGSQKVCTFWIKAGQTSGVDATLTLTVTDSKGLTFTTSKSWPIVADEF